MRSMAAKDLSFFHWPVSASFYTDCSDARAGLSTEQIEFYKNHGFVTGVPVLSGAQIESLRNELSRLMQPEQADNPLFYEYHHNESSDPETVLFHALGAWRVSPEFHDLIYLPSVVTAAEQLLGGPVRFWHDQLFVKPPRDGAVVEWHQDYSYWTRTKPMAHLTCWIGLDDSTENNGCVRYIPGSHRWELLPRYHLSGSMSTVFEFLTDEQRAAFEPVPSLPRAGHASFHHPLMLHGSYENTSDRPRRAAVINFFRDGVISDSDEPLLHGVPPVPRGEKVAGQFFPLLSRPNS
jgi:ectoine hydroxylase-related dioxygenase (phytanoyl-CoA dioxygenase family)